MIGRLWLLACGQVRVRVTGASLTRFLNLCAAQGITLRQMDRTAWNELHATLSIRDFRTLRRHMGRTGCRVHILRKRGLPFLAARLRPRTALWGGPYSPRHCAGCSARMGDTDRDRTGDRQNGCHAAAERNGVRIGMPIKKLNTRQIRWK
ncbi:MAG: sporulation protein YqfD [Butyricicoccus sp.]